MLIDDNDNDVISTCCSRKANSSFCCETVFFSFSSLASSSNNLRKNKHANFFSVKVQMWTVQPHCKLYLLVATVTGPFREFSSMHGI